MYEIKVLTMSCDHCVKRIQKALDVAEIDSSISLEHKTVSIKGCENCYFKAQEIIKKLGYKIDESNQ